MEVFKGISMTHWKSYEEVAAYLLGEFSHEFGLERVEGKQKIKGQRSGTDWEIDAKGIRENDSGFLIIECRCHTTTRQSQEQIGALAYRITDTGAAGGIVVSPLGLQAGAEKVAHAENIVKVHLDKDSTQHEYVLSFLNRVMVGVADSIAIQLNESVEIEVRDADGKILRRINGAGTQCPSPPIWENRKM